MLLWILSAIRCYVRGGRSPITPALWRQLSRRHGDAARSDRQSPEPIPCGTGSSDVSSRGTLMPMSEALSKGSYGGSRAASRLRSATLQGIGRGATEGASTRIAPHAVRPKALTNRRPCMWGNRGTFAPKAETGTSAPGEGTRGRQLPCENVQGKAMPANLARHGAAPAATHAPLSPRAGGVPQNRCVGGGLDRCVPPMPKVASHGPIAAKRPGLLTPSVRVLANAGGQKERAHLAIYSFCLRPGTIEGPWSSPTP